jgi:hypothetical protein
VENLLVCGVQWSVLSELGSVLAPVFQLNGTKDMRNANRQGKGGDSGQEGVKGSM